MAIGASPFISATDLILIFVVIAGVTATMAIAASCVTFTIAVTTSFVACYIHLDETCAPVLEW